MEPLAEPCLLRKAESDRYQRRARAARIAGPGPRLMKRYPDEPFSAARQSLSSLGTGTLIVSNPQHGEKPACQPTKRELLTRAAAGGTRARGRRSSSRPR